MGDLAGWPYWKVISITGQSGAGTDYQVELEIGDSAGGDFHLEGHCANFPQDIRITDDDGTTLLDHWVENLTADPIVVHVEVKDDLGSNQTIRVYYGKSGETTSSNGHTTFEAFDSGETGDKTYWTEDNGGVEIVTDPKNGTYGIKGNQGAGSGFLNAGYIGNSESDFVYEGWVKPTANNWGGITIRRSGTTTFYLFWFNNGASISPVGITLTKMISGARTDLTSGALTYSLGTWYRFKITANDTSLKLDIGENNIIDTTDSSIVSGYAGIGGHSGTNREVVVDDIFVRKYNSPEPAFSSAGAEQTPAVGAIMNQFQKANIGADLYNGAFA